MAVEIEIFQTNVADESAANLIVKSLLALLPDARINFDLEDCDKILRIEHAYIPIAEIESEVSALGFSCRVLL